MPSTAHPTALIILDGWGWSDDKIHNPLHSIPTPTFDYLFSQCPHRLIQASGGAVGLPDNQIGNSEVGHLHLGAGRLVLQDLTRINKAIETGEFDKNRILQEALTQAKQTDAAIHILGLVSPGGVHSHEQHIAALIKLLAKEGLTRSYVHAFLDGRDVAPKSAQASLISLDNLMRDLKCGRFASVIGRYYAMDRDNRWDRVQKAYDLLIEGKAEYHADSAEIALANAYQRQEGDEFVKATLIGKAATIAEGDIVIFMNFRADRARQLSHALTDVNFHPFKREKVVHLGAFLSLTEYDSELPEKIIFPSIAIHNTLGEYLANLGLTQLRIAETEKYAHVTYFFNGGIEIPFPGEQRVLIPSPKVATYDLQPEMNAEALTDQLVEAILSKRYTNIVCNYANFDMIGHTGNVEAALKTIKIIDQCLAEVITALEQSGMDALITADHGNIECIYDESHHQPHTAHTTNLVPLVYVGQRAAKFNDSPGSLADVAPSLLYLMGLKQPTEMTGHTLIEFK